MSEQPPNQSEAQKPPGERVEDVDDRQRLARIEDDLSRLRTVLYLLVKDEPDMLRLLGVTPEPSSREGGGE